MAFAPCKGASFHSSQLAYGTYTAFPPRPFSMQRPKKITQNSEPAKHGDHPACHSHASPSGVSTASHHLTCLSSSRRPGSAQGRLGSDARLLLMLLSPALSPLLCRPPKDTCDTQVRRGESGAAKCGDCELMLHMQLEWTGQDEARQVMPAQASSHR